MFNFGFIKIKIMWIRTISGLMWFEVEYTQQGIPIIKTK